MALFWDVAINGIQGGLDRLEQGGVLVGRPVGRTRVYEWNPRWPFRKELQGLLDKALGFLPDEDRHRLQMNRRRPRRRGKPL